MSSEIETMRYLVSSALLLATPLAAQTSINPISAVQQVIEAVCVPVPMEGSSQSVQVKADAEAGLSSLLKGFADAGLEGAADFNSSSYVGFLQTELSGQVESQRDCNILVFQTFSPKINDWISESSANSESNTTNTINNSGDNNVNIQGPGNTVSR